MLGSVGLSCVSRNVKVKSEEFADCAAQFLTDVKLRNNDECIIMFRCDIRIIFQQPGGKERSSEEGLWSRSLCIRPLQVPGLNLKTHLLA